MIWGKDGMGTNYYAVRNRPTVDRPIHIGKSSAGWMFDFQTQNDPYNDPPVVWNTFNQVRLWLRTHTGPDKEYVIMDEYDRIISLDDFLDLVESKQKEDADNPRNFKHSRNVDGYRFTDEDFC